MDTPFIIEKSYKAPRKKVWRAITNKDDMKQWYFDLADFKPEVGFEFEFRGGKEEAFNIFTVARSPRLSQKKNSLTVGGTKDMKVFLLSRSSCLTKEMKIPG